jgi:hypothetical protein
MQIKSALFCLVTILVVFTSAGPVGSIDDKLADSSTVSKTNVKNPLNGVNLNAVLGTVSKVADKVKGAV